MKYSIKSNMEWMSYSFPVGIGLFSCLKTLGHAGRKDFDTTRLAWECLLENPDQHSASERFKAQCNLSKQIIF